MRPTVYGVHVYHCTRVLTQKPGFSSSSSSSSNSFLPTPPPAQHGNITHRGEDPFLWVDARDNWHALFHTSGNTAGAPIGTHCGNSSVASHAFSDDGGKTWSELADHGHPPVQPYKPTVAWDDDAPEKPQTYATMERPHLYFHTGTGGGGGTGGRATHLGVAATLNIGDEGCPDAFPSFGCRHKKPCSCSSCKYISHAGTLLIELA